MPGVRVWLSICCVSLRPPVGYCIDAARSMQASCKILSENIACVESDAVRLMIAWLASLLLRTTHVASYMNLSHHLLRFICVQVAVLLLPLVHVPLRTYVTFLSKQARDGRNVNSHKLSRLHTGQARRESPVCGSPARRPPVAAKTVPASPACHRPLLVL
jgi:hypothetical protein